MAIYKQDIVNINLESGSIFRSFLNKSIGHKDDDADRFGIRAFRDGEPVDLSGLSCQAVFMAPNGVNIALTSYGTVSGNEAYVTLPPACYDYEGQFCLAIKLVGGGVTSTVRIVDGVVERTGTSGAVTPTSAVPTYQEILSVYDDMVAATSAANLAIAEEFDASKNYPASKNVINDGALYILPNGHTAGTTWANTTKVASNLGDQVSELKSAIGTVTEKTNNLWTFGDVEFTEQYNVDVDLPAGDYNISAFVSDGTNTGSSNMYFYDANNNAVVKGFGLGTRTVFGVTFSTAIKKIRLYARTAWSDSQNKQANYKEVLITAGAGKYNYRKSETAVDYIARDYFEGDESSTVYASGFLKDYLSEHDGKYVLMQSTNGRDFTILDTALPSELVAYDASAIISYNGYFIIGVHDVFSGNEGMQFFTTKDFVNWTQSIVNFPSSLLQVYNSAIAFYIDNNDLYVSWSAEYQTISGDSTIYHLPHYMKLAFNDGAITGTNTWGDIAIGNSANNDSYIDPFVLKVENGYVVAIKNEINRTVEIYKGSSLQSLSLYVKMIGQGVEAPSMLFDSRTRTITLYGSGYWLGDVGIDILLYDSWRIIGNVTDPVTTVEEREWSLAEYGSNYQIRHPYISKLDLNATQNLKRCGIVPAPPFPYNRELHYTLKSDGKFYMGSRPLTHFVAHPRIRLFISSEVDTLSNEEYGLLPIKNQDAYIIVDSSNGHPVSFVFDNYGWGDYEGKRLVANNGSRMVIGFKAITWQSQYRKGWLGDANALSLIQEVEND